jgi:HPt (histidine-containing phosphotransfer) domain-containing protein
MATNGNALFDRATLESEWGAETAIEMARCFAEDTGNVLQDLAQYASVKDSDKVRTQAHMLKGCCRVICARSVENVSANIELAAMRGDWPTVLAKIEKLQPLYLQLSEELDAYLKQAAT